MQTDRYTRIVLTIIAAALVWICLRDTAAPVFAQDNSSLTRDVSSIEGYVSRIYRGTCLNSKICF